VNVKGQLRPLDLVQTAMNRGLEAIADRIVNPVGGCMSVSSAE
jgi:hypothetical protein